MTEEAATHRDVWRFYLNPDTDGVEEIQVCALCSPKHTGWESIVRWPCAVMTHPAGSGRLTDTTDPTRLAKISAIIATLESAKYSLALGRVELGRVDPALGIAAAITELSALLDAARRTEAETKADPQITDYARSLERIIAKTEAETEAEARAKLTAYYAESDWFAWDSSQDAYLTGFADGRAASLLAQHD